MTINQNHFNYFLKTNKLVSYITYGFIFIHHFLDPPKTVSKGQACGTERIAIQSILDPGWSLSNCQDQAGAVEQEI